MNALEFRRQFGDNLRDLRRGAGLTQASLAQKIGTVNVTISMYERGKRLPGLEILSMLACALGASFEDLVPIMDLPGDNLEFEGQTSIFDIEED